MIKIDPPGTDSGTVQPTTPPIPPSPVPTPPASNARVGLRGVDLFPPFSPDGNSNFPRNLFPHTNNDSHGSSAEAKAEDEEEEDVRPPKQKRRRSPLEDKTGPDVDAMAEDDGL